MVNSKNGPFECLLSTGEFFGSADVGDDDDKEPNYVDHDPIRSYKRGRNFRSASTDLLHPRQRVGSVTESDLFFPSNREKHIFPGQSRHPRLVRLKNTFHVGTLSPGDTGQVGDHTVQKERIFFFIPFFVFVTHLFIHFIIIHFSGKRVLKSFLLVFSIFCFRDTPRHPP